MADDKDRIVRKDEKTNSYVNGRGEALKFTEKSMSIYSTTPDKPHAATHINIDNEKGFLKEIVANGNIALLPKLMSAEGISTRDTKALTNYVKTFGFYDDFMTYTQLKLAELGREAALQKGAEGAGASSGGKVGRPKIAENNIENDATAKSVENGTNTSDNREQQ